MANLLSTELLLMQQSRCTAKYQSFTEELPEQFNQSIYQPMGKYSRRISALVKNRGRMLFILDKKVSKFLKKHKL